MRKRRTADEAGVVLTYDDFYGRAAQLDDLIGTLRKFAVEDWLCQLARLSILLAGQNSRRPKWANAFLQNFTPSHLIDKVNAWFQRFNKKGIVATVPSERDVGILIELAILHSPAKAPRRMDFPQDARVVFDAILMVAGLAQPKLEGLSKREIVSVFASLWLRSFCPNPLTLATHGYHLFEVLAPNRSPKAAEWATLFEQATGQDLDDYFAGGLTILTQLLNQSPQDIASCWTSVLDPKHLDKFPKLKKPVEAYCKLRTSSLSGLAQAIRDEYELCQEDLGSFNLIAIKKTPLIEYQNTVYPLYLHGIASSLLDGIYHAAILPGRQNAKQRRGVGGVFGKLHEMDILSVLESGLGDRLLRNPVRKDNGEEAADAIVICESGLVVFQIKGSHTTVQEKFRLRTPGTLQQLFERVGLVNGAKQLVKTVQACRDDLVEGVPAHWTRAETPIQPVIVTFERVPEFSLVKPEIDCVVAGAKVDRFVRSPALLCREDIERIVQLPGGKTLWSVLAEYADSRGSSCSFHNFLNDKKIGAGSLSADRQRQMIGRVVEHFGYDINEVANDP